MTTATAAKTSHTVTWDPQPEKGRYHGLNGLEVMKRVLAEGGGRSPISALLDFDMTHAEVGRVKFVGRPGPQHLNPIGIVHGGFAATLLDAALWSAVQTTIEPGFGNTTVDLKVNYFRPMTAQMGEVTCEAWIVNRGSRVAFAEAQVSDAAGKLYAHGASTLMILTL